MSYTKTDLTVVSKGWGNETLGRGAVLSNGATVLKGREDSGIIMLSPNKSAFIQMINGVIYIQD